MTTANVNISVVSRALLTADGEGKAKVTIDLLNDLGNPIVTGTIETDAVIRYPVLTVSNVTTSKNTVAIQMYLSTGTVTGRHRVYAWLVDSDTDFAMSTDTPSITARKEWDLVTDANGLFTLTIEHGGTRDWYLAVEYAGMVYVSDVITFTA